MNDTEVSLKFKNSVTGEKKLEKYAESLKTINTMLSGMDKGMMQNMEQSANSIKSMSKDTKQMKDKISGAFNYVALTKFIGVVKKLGNSFAKLSKQSFDFLENFNLFQVAFGGNYKSAERFVNKMSEMFGLDESWLTQTIGKFKQLANAMNLTEETGEKVAKLLTEMSLDISSLYNVDISRAASTLSSAMAGQTKPIRGVAGADITQATLQTTLDQLGIDNTVDKLSFAEKRLLIIISLTKQLNASIGDMGRTIESPSNQLRIMNEQWERLTRAVGNVFLPILSKILPYLNAILMVLTEIISTIASLLGFNMGDYDYFEKPSESVWDLDSGLKSAGTSAKKLKQGLRGFDKLNVITTPSSGGSGSGGGSGVGGVNPKLLDAFNKTFEDYQKRFGDIEMKATRIRDRILEWLGFTKIIDEETGDVSFKFDHITGGTVLGALGVGGAIYKGITIIGSIFTKITGLKFTSLFSLFGEGGLIAKGAALVGKIGTAVASINPVVAGIVAAVAALVGTFVHLYKTNEEFREKVNNFAEEIKKDIKPMVEGFLDTAKKALNKIKPIIEFIYKEVIKPLGNLLVSVLEPVLNEVLDTLKILYDNVIKPAMPLIKSLADIYISAIATHLKLVWTWISKIVEVLQFLWNTVLSPLVTFVKNKITSKIKNVTEDIKTIIEWIKKLINWLKDLKDKFKLPELKLPKLPKIKLKVEFDTNVNKVKKAIYTALGLDGWPKLSFEKYANGGLPPVGQLFVANERGPELVGSIGGQSFVANQNQMADFLDRKFANTQSSKTPQIFNIYLDENHKICTYTIEQLQDMAKTNGRPIRIGG